MTDLIEDFYGVYLLYNVSDRYIGQVYIGFTIDPNRRIMQHNKGISSGGARKTSCKGPWEMVLIVHGFPNEVSALRFEWAWQHPKKSRRLKHLDSKKLSEKTYDYSIRILLEMLRTGPWNRLPLTIRWLKENFEKDFPANLVPPWHMPIVYGPITSKKLSNEIQENSENTISSDRIICFICNLDVENENLITCINPKCNLKCHIVCLSQCILSDKNEIIPIEGDCPLCNVNLLWGDLVRKRKGCYKYLNENIMENSDFSDLEIN